MVYKEGGTILGRCACSVPTPVALVLTNLNEVLWEKLAVERATYEYKPAIPPVAHLCLVSTNRSTSSLNSGAKNVCAAQFDINIVLVDSPGFDDTTKSDLEVLGLISEHPDDNLRTDIKEEI